MGVVTDAAERFVDGIADKAEHLWALSLTQQSVLWMVLLIKQSIYGRYH